MCSCGPFWGCASLQSRSYASILREFRLCFCPLCAMQFRASIKTTVGLRGSKALKCSSPAYCVLILVGIIQSVKSGFSIFNKCYLTAHGTLLSVMWQPAWGSLGENGYMDIYMAESFHCSPEVITALLIGYTSMENKKFKLKKNKSGFNSLSSIFRYYVAE